jgi:lysophospholipase L1-like esterase
MIVSNRQSESIPSDFENNFQEIRNLCLEQGVHLAVLTRQQLRPNPPVPPYNQRLRAWASTQGVARVPIVAAFNSVKDPRSLYNKPETDFVHPNEEGYALVARTTFSILVEAGYTDWNE